MADSIPRAKSCKPFPSKVSLRSVPRYIPVLTLSLVPPLPKQMYVFTQDLERLKADLEVADGEAAVVQRYKDGFAAKVEARRKLDQILVPSCLHISKFAQVLERLDEIGGVGKGALIAAARERRIDQSAFSLCTTYSD